VRRELVWSAGLSMLAHGLIILGMTQVPWSLASAKLWPAAGQFVEVVLLEPERTAPEPSAAPAPQSPPQPPVPPRRALDPKAVNRAPIKPLAPSKEKTQREALPETTPRQEAQLMSSPEQGVEASPETSLVASAPEDSGNGPGLQDGWEMGSDRKGGNAVLASIAGPAGSTGGNAGGGPLREATPRYDINPRPAYPEVARRRGLEGTVVLTVRVRGDGGVGEVKLARTSGFDVLDQAALQAVVGWQFIPGRRGDQPMEMEVRVPVRFQLH